MHESSEQQQVCVSTLNTLSNLFADGLNGNYNGIHHVGVLCKDISASLTFYRDILGGVPGTAKTTPVAAPAYSPSESLH